MYEGGQLNHSSDALSTYLQYKNISDVKYRKCIYCREKVKISISIVPIQSIIILHVQPRYNKGLSTTSSM